MPGEGNKGPRAWAALHAAAAHGPSESKQVVRAEAAADVDGHGALVIYSGLTKSGEQG